MGLLDGVFGGLSNPFDEQGSQFIRGLLAQGLNPFSANGFAPQQPDPRAFNALAQPNAPQPPSAPVQLGQKSYPMQEVENEDAPQPPPRPKGLLAGDAQSPSAPVASPAPQSAGNPLQAFGDMIGGIYGKGGPGDGLIALGAGLMSKRRFGEGLQAGLDNMQRNQLVQGQAQLQQQKLQQQQAGLQGRMAYLKQNFPNLTPEALLVYAQNDKLFEGMANRANPSEQYAQEKDDEGNIWSVNKMTGQKTIALKAEADPEQPSSVKEYEYAKANGFTGSYQDWQTQSGPGKQPATVQEYEYAKKNGFQGSFEDWQNKKAMKFANFDEGAQADLVRSLAARARAGDTTWKTGLARDPGLIRAVEVELARQGMATPEGNNAQEILQNRANQAGRVREQGTLGTATANNTLYGNAAANTIDTAISASREVPRTNWVPVNRLLQMNQSAISDPKLAAFRTALLTTVNDYAKATTPTGTPTDSQRAHAYEVLNTAVGPEGVEAVLRMMHREIANTHRAIELTKTQLQSGKGGHLPELTAEPAGPNVHGSQGVGMWDAVKSVFGGGSNAAPISVKSPDEARKLPPGTAFQTPDGRTFTR